MNIGEKIKNLRKERGLSQNALADRLGVTFQAVSKWETGATMPDLTLIPAIAAFFGVSTDEMFDFNLYEIEKAVDGIVDEFRKHYGKGGSCADPEECEAILREGLKSYPGNDVLLNCLLEIIPTPERAEEVIEIGMQLVSSTRSDEIRLDAYRIMAEAYKSIGEDTLCESMTNEIPEIYFSRLFVRAELLDGEKKFEAAAKEKTLCAEHLVRMLEVLAECYAERGEPEKAKVQLEIAEAVISAFENDFGTDYTTSVYDPAKLEEIRARIKKCSKTE